MFIHISLKHSLLQKEELDGLKFLIESVFVLILHAVCSAAARTSPIHDIHMAAIYEKLGWGAQMSLCCVSGCKLYEHIESDKSFITS